MQTFTKLFIATIVMLALTISCNNDEINSDSGYPIIGTWVVTKTEVDVTPLPTATMTEIQLEAALADYTFFIAGSQVIFTADSITLTSELNDATQPTMTLPYTVSKGILTIFPPIMLQSGTLQGDVSVEKNTMEFDMSAASYMELLQYISYGFPDFQNITNQIKSATVDFDFTRVP